MSKGIAKDFYTSIIELISNAYDADTHRLNLQVTIDSLVIEDDGTGMDQNSIHKFFDKGTDYKRLNPHTDGGRKRLGRFGLATLLLKHLGNAYKLETWKDKEKITVTQNFARDGWKNPQVTVSRELKEKTEHGTRITIIGSNYRLGSEEFNLEELTSRLIWGFAPLPDFKIILNEQEIENRGVVTYATEYDVTSKLTKSLKISGSIYTRDRSKGKMPFGGGILLYVNGRQVGDPDDFKLASIDGRFQGQLLGVINIEGMDEDIAFDRSGFIESRSYRMIKDYILRVLQSIKTDLDRTGGTTRVFYKARRMAACIDDALQEAQEKLNVKLGLKGSSAYKLELDSGEKSGPVSCFDNTTNTIYINQSNPQLIKPPLNSTKNLDNLLLFVALSALADYQVLQTFPDARPLLDQLGQHVVSTSSTLFAEYDPINIVVRAMGQSGDVASIKEVYFNDFRLYTIPDLIYLTGWDVNTLRALFLAECLSADRHDDFKKERKVLGKKAREFLPQIEGYSPAGLLVDPDEWRRDKHYSYKFDLDRALEPHIHKVDYLKNVGVSQPFIFVKKGTEEEFLRFVKTHGIRR